MRWLKQSHLMVGTIDKVYYFFCAFPLTYGRMKPWFAQTTTILTVFDATSCIALANITRSAWPPLQAISRFYRRQILHG